MRLILALCGVVLVAGCSSVPVQPVETVQRLDSSCDYALMNRIDQAHQPYLVARYWAHCPQIRGSARS